MHRYQLALLAVVALTATVSASLIPTDVSEMTAPETPAWLVSEENNPTKRFLRAGKTAHATGEEEERGFEWTSKAIRAMAKTLGYTRLRPKKEPGNQLAKIAYNEHNEFANWFIAGKSPKVKAAELKVAKAGVNSEEFRKLVRYGDYFQRYKVIATRFHLN
ncbi:hypothetical protein ON010_g1861 [Phytophthora cinnamomi]|nr:hypothetical protein ON010_g1861 [Phytophthora cinnamomi]